MGIICHP